MSYKCGICGVELATLDEYLKHTQMCVKEQKIKEEDLQKMNHDLDRVKAAKEYFETQLEAFKVAYPDAYKMNFGDCKCGGKCNGNEAVKAESQPKVRSFSLESDKDGIKVNGKKMTEADAIKAEDAFVRDVCKLLGI